MNTARFMSRPARETIGASRAAAFAPRPETAAAASPDSRETTARLPLRRSLKKSQVRKESPSSQQEHRLPSKYFTYVTLNYVPIPMRGNLTRCYFFAGFLIIGLPVLGVVLVALLATVFVMYRRERSGNPLFEPLISEEDRKVRQCHHFLLNVYFILGTVKLLQISEYRWYLLSLRVQNQKESPDDLSSEMSSRASSYTASDEETADTAT